MLVSESFVMSIKKLDDGQYQVDVRPQGRKGTRIRRKFVKKHEATAFERHVLANQHDKAWLSKPKDARPVSELIRLWWSYHGQHEKWGAVTKTRLDLVDRSLGSVCAFQLDAVRIAAYRSQQLMKGNKASTINRELARLSGMFTALIDSGLFHGDNPLGEMHKLKISPTAMSYLTQAEIKALLVRFEGNNHKIVVFCLSTGARWSEAVELQADHVVSRRAIFVKTKNGRQRVVPISAELEEFIRGDGQGLVFPGADYDQIRRALREIKPMLPKGQALHVLRHTYATHFMINGGNIITLQRILGHATIQQTMAYAHFAPDYLQDAVTLNPLGGKLAIA
jgi:site-specific recombinase XerD